MEDAMIRVIEHVFNNWTGLQLAVEHGMAGPNSRQTALECLDYMISFCLNEANDVSDIQEALEDIMDQEFDTICEDGSIEEISTTLFKFLELIKVGNVEQYEVEYKKLPVSKDWLKSQNAAVPEIMGCSSQPEIAGEKMEEQDPEWVQVKSRRRK